MIIVIIPIATKFQGSNNNPPSPTLPLSLFLSLSPSPSLSSPPPFLSFVPPAGIELIQSPVWLLHGDQDTVISQSVSLHLMQKLTSPVELKVIENGSHWLCRPEDTQHLLEAIDSLIHPSDAEQDDD